MNSTVKVHLLGRDYLLRSQGDPQQVQDAAALVEERLAGLSDLMSVDTRDRFMLAMLNLAGEHLQLRRRNRQLEQDLRQLQEQQAEIDRVRARSEEDMIERIETALDH